MKRKNHIIDFGESEMGPLKYEEKKSYCKEKFSTMCRK